MTVLACDKERRAAVLKSTWNTLASQERDLVTTRADEHARGTAPLTYYAARVDDRAVLQKQTCDIHVATLSGEEQSRCPGLQTTINIEITKNV